MLKPRPEGLGSRQSKFQRPGRPTLVPVLRTYEFRGAAFPGLTAWA